MVGTRIGDYAIERELRSEATGVVHLGVHVILPRRAAIKILHAGSLLREACILEALSHPGVPRIYECGVLADQRPWVATELIDGNCLADAPPVTLAELVTIVRAVADILGHAHGRGVVHQRLVERVVVLTPGRVTPVCLRGWGDVVTHELHPPAEPASDVYSLGALAQRALQGTCPEAPAELTRLIDDMLGTDPAARPGAAEVCERADWLAETLESAAAVPGIRDLAVRIRG